MSLGLILVIILIVILLGGFSGDLVATDTAMDTVVSAYLASS